MSEEKPKKSVYEYFKSEYEKTDFYCPICGKQEVEREKGEGDFYWHEQYLCRACTADFYMPFICETVSRLNKNKAV